ncbi:neuronal acetylcholine receptor subunit alpha-6-like [Littorina saxatilis]|uniref:neuronal acetylcholine receptor subunit alpha-6-like n=1 Tax=Littorina saxatilis TaxID=31220 RepID=UPI0038B4BE01
MASNTTRFFSSHLLRDYDTLVSPKQAQAGGTTVHVRIGVKALHGVDLSRQTMTILAWFSLYWSDERLIWDAAESGFQSIHLNSRTVWIPEIVIFNTLLSLDELTDSGRDLIVKHDGNVTWWPGGVFKTFCSLDITYYPFDVHVCSLQLTTWTYNMHQINLTILPPAFENADYSESSAEWTVTAAGVTTFYSSSTPYKTLKFEFRLKRKVLFYVANVLVPIFLVSSLNCVVLRVPAGSGEKMTVCLTSFLTFLTYLKVTVDTLPRNSDVFCYFGLYLSLQLVISVFTVAMAATAVWLGWREKMYCEAKKKRTFFATKEDSGRANSEYRDSNVWNYRERRFAIPGDDAEQQHAAVKRNLMATEFTEEKDKDAKVLRFSERVEKAKELEEEIKKDVRLLRFSERVEEVEICL